MTWHQHKKDQNYYTRLALINKVRKAVCGVLKFNVPMNLSCAVPYSYSGGKRVITKIELYKYMSNFKREFTNIRVILDDGTTVPLAKLRTKHLTKIYQLLNK
jgi:hypothetical protein